MAASVFDDKKKVPQVEDLRLELGRSWALWEALKKRLADRYDPLAEEWIFSGEKWGWSLRLKHKNRAVLYLTPSSGHFRAGLVLGEGAVKTALGMDLTEDVVRQLRSARKYVEGRGVRLEVRHKRDLDPVVRLAEAKMESGGKVDRPRAHR